MQTKRVLAGVLTSTLLLGACPAALAADYNDSSLTGGSAAWQAWTEGWAARATDYTQVSLTPGADETQLNFAWYSKDADGAATPVVHFGTDRNNLASFEGTSAAVDSSLTDGEAYSYNHVTVTGLQPNTTYYYSVEKSGAETEVQTYTTGDFESAQILYVGDPQIGASRASRRTARSWSRTAARPTPRRATTALHGTARSTLRWSRTPALIL